MAIDDKIHDEVKRLIKIGFCYDEKTGRSVNWCFYYNKDGCPQTCDYARRKLANLPVVDLFPIKFRK